MFLSFVSPSTSESERIPHDFNEAEMYGAIGLCNRYIDNCPQSIFDIISVVETYWAIACSKKLIFFSEDNNNNHKPQEHI